jgi:hypothetical protein
VATIPQAAGTTNVYFKDFFRTFRRNGAISLKGRWELGEGDDNCVQCHKSGILPIFPVEGSVSTDEQEAVLAVNRRFMTYGPARFDKYLDTSKFGPGLSTANADDRKQRFGAEFGKTVVAHAMTCSACHQQQRLGAFSWPMDRVLISSFINGGRMPLGSSLKVSERGELYGKLIQEYFAIDERNPGTLKRWLLGKAGTIVR